MKKAVFTTLVLALCMSAFAQSPSPVTSTSNTATAATTLTSVLTLNATINTALALDISSATGGCTITSSGLSPTKSYSMSFGNLDGLGLSTPAPCVTATKSTVAGGGYIYTSPYNYVARFSGFTPTSTGAPKLEAYYSQTSTISSSAVQVVEGSTASGATPLSTSSASPTSIATGLTSDETNTPVTRFLGLQVFEFNGANASPNAAAGAAYSATITFVLAPQ